MWDNCLDHTYHSKYVDIEHLASLIEGYFLNCAAYRIASVVDQNVDPAKALDGLVNCQLDGVRPGDIQW
jgi:hypothetical protein